MNIDTALTNATRDLRTSSDSARLDAELLLMFTLGKPRSHLFAHPEKALSQDESSRFAALIGRRQSSEPVAYITGEKEFWSLDLCVSPATLVPRPETEVLVEETLSIIPADAEMTILDLGTGSGAIAIAIASERPNCRIVATDLSTPALAVAANNARRHTLGNIDFRQGAWFDAVGDDVFDVVVSNPPYVASGDPALEKLVCEPRGALVAGRDGLDDIRLIVAAAGKHLADGGSLLLEHGADQELAVAAILASAGWQDTVCLADLAGLPRVTRSTWQGQESPAV